jgi:di/tricarboxylate transporter
MSVLALAATRIDYLRLVGGLLGPVLFLLTWVMAPAYTGLGVMLWLATYWACGVIPVIYTAFIPILGFSLMGVDPKTIFLSFFHPALLLIVGPTMVIVAAVHCGLMDRMAQFFIRRVGPSVRAQTVFWLVFATIISDFAADVVIALALIPIVVKLLYRAGYDSIEKIAASKEAMLLVIATSIGAGLGGILTPMAGGQAAITWTALNKALGGEVTALSFTLRMLLPTTVCLGIIAGIFALLAPSGKTFNFALAWGDKHPKDVGATRWSRHEKVVAVLFVLAICLPYVRPWLPFSLPWIYTGLLVVTMLLWVPGVGMVLPVKALKQFPISAVSVWPIAMSVSVLVGVTGTGQQVLNLVGNFWASDPWVAVGTWIALCVSMAQVASDTGTAGMLIPILGDALPKVGINPVPWIMMTGFSVDLSFMVPTATGTIGVLYALGGRSHFRLPLYGFLCAASCGLFAWLFWAVVIKYELAFWFTLDVIK